MERLERSYSGTAVSRLNAVICVLGTRLTGADLACRGVAQAKSPCARYRRAVRPHHGHFERTPLDRANTAVRLGFGNSAQFWLDLQSQYTISRRWSGRAAPRSSGGYGRLTRHSRRQRATLAVARDPKTISGQVSDDECRIFHPGPNRSKGHYPDHQSNPIH